MTFYGFMVANSVFWLLLWGALGALFLTKPKGDDVNMGCGCLVLAGVAGISLIAVMVGGWVS